MRVVRLVAVSPLFLLAFGALVSPTTSVAAPKTWYVSPNGSGLNTCGPADPCDSITSTSNAASGDTVVFFGDQGTYQSAMSPTSTVLHVKDGVTVTGAPGQPTPVWYSGVGTPNDAVIMEGTSSKLVDFDIEDGGSFGVALGAKGTVDRVIAHATDSGGWGCTLPTGVNLSVTVTNSICQGSVGWAQEVGGGPWNITFRNDLLSAPGNALVITGGSGTVVNVNATNTIFHSTGSSDVYAHGTSASLTVTADHSNFSTTDVSGATVSAPGSGTNQNAPPQFVTDGADFREAAGSPTIDAGVDDPLNGPFDLAGAARTSGARTDIGPYEVQVAAVSPPGGAAPSPGITTGVTPPPPAVRPAISGLVESPRTWREGSGLPRLARKRRPPVGTTFSFRLNEAARVSLTFTQSAAGRRVSGRCVRPTRRSARKPRCRRTVTAGALSLAAHAGTNRLRFQGRLSRTRRLRPGRYAALVVATASSGLRSVPRSVSFTIVR